MTNPEKQPEITPETVRAGAEVVAWYDERFDTKEEIATLIYSAMREAEVSSEAP